MGVFVATKDGQTTIEHGGGIEGVQYLARL